jgi:hypothetical protein
MNWSRIGAGVAFELADDVRYGRFRLGVVGWSVLVFGEILAFSLAYQILFVFGSLGGLWFVLAGISPIAVLVVRAKFAHATRSRSAATKNRSTAAFNRAYEEVLSRHDVDVVRGDEVTDEMQAEMSRLAKKYGYRI